MTDQELLNENRKLREAAKADAEEISGLHDFIDRLNDYLLSIEQQHKTEIDHLEARLNVMRHELEAIKNELNN